MIRSREQSIRTICCVLFGLIFLAAGAAHFMQADGFAKMLPAYVPGRLAIIYATGILEIVLAALLISPVSRRQTGIVIAWYLVLIFPANIYAAWKGIPAPGMSDTPQAALWIRLLFQPLLIWWVLWASRPPRH